jgi:hypothetical protein
VVFDFRDEKKSSMYHSGYTCGSFHHENRISPQPPLSRDGAVLPAFPNVMFERSGAHS